MANKKNTRTQQSAQTHQKQRYDKEAAEYDASHSNSHSTEYRKHFYRNRLLSFDLLGKKVLDGMSGPGIDTGYMISRGAEVTGLDISAMNASIFQEKWNRPCAVASINDTAFPATVLMQFILQVASMTLYLY
jgi:2-polyprenyl-3-methyl-5-hydroxy-6-metoxy-1,4-benzoquinol methylase